MKLPSPSKHELAKLCAASFALPHVDFVNHWMSRGIVIHAFLRDVPKFGRDVALEKVPPQFRGDCEVIDLSVLPACEPDAYAAEVTIAYDVDTGEVRELGRELTREEMRARKKPSEICGTPDVIGLTADAVLIPDYKTGFTVYGPSKEIQQLRDYAFLAAKLYGKTRAISGITRIHEDGSSYSDKCEFDAFDLATIELEIQEMAAAVRAEQAHVAAGGVPHATEGDHCSRCPALPYCPAKMALVRQFAAAPENLDIQVELANDEQLAVAYDRVLAVEKVVERVKHAIATKARKQPIPMGNGYVLGEVAQEKLVLGVAVGVIGAKHGPQVAQAATESEPEISKASVERALKKHVLRPGQKMTHLMNELMEAIREANGTKPAGIVKKHKPKAEEPKELPPASDEVAA